jgi:MFS family permease
MTSLSDIRSLAARQTRAGGWHMVLLLMLVQIVSYIDRFLPSLLVPAIKNDLRLNDFQVGLLLGPAFALFYVVVGLPFGWAADRFSRRAILAFGVAAWSSMTAAASMALSFAPLFAARLGVGFGEAAVAPCAVSLISDRFDAKRRPRAVSLYMSGSFIGAGLAFLLGGPLVRWLQTAPPLAPGLRPWQSAFLLVGLPGLGLALLMFTFQEPARAQLTRTTAASLTAAGKFILERWKAFGTLFVGSACVVTLGALSLWNVALFQRTWGWNVGQVGVASGLMFFTAGPLGTLAGLWLTQRWQAQGRIDCTLRALLTGLAIGAPAMVLFPLAPNVGLGLCGMFLGFVGQAMATAAGPVSLSYLAPGRIRAQATAIYYLLISLAGQLLGPPPVGWMVDRFGDPHALRYAVSIEAALVSAPTLIILSTGLSAFRASAERLEQNNGRAAHD